MYIIELRELMSLHRRLITGSSLFFHTDSVHDPNPSSPTPFADSI